MSQLDNPALGTVNESCFSVPITGHRYRCFRCQRLSNQLELWPNHSGLWHWRPTGDLCDRLSRQANPTRKHATANQRLTQPPITQPPPSQTAKLVRAQTAIDTHTSRPSYTGGTL